MQSTEQRLSRACASNITKILMANSKNIMFKLTFSQFALLAFIGRQIPHVHKLRTDVQRQFFHTLKRFLFIPPWIRKHQTISENIKRKWWRICQNRSRVQKFAERKTKKWRNLYIDISGGKRNTTINLWSKNRQEKFSN